MSLNVAPIDFWRKRFEKASAFYSKQGIAPQKSFLRIEENLINGSGVYQFNLRKENLSAVERNLRRNDLFIVCQMGVYLRIEDNNKAGVLPPLFYAKQGRATITPADTSTHVGRIQALTDYGFATSDIEALWNGSLFVQTGSIVNFEAMPCSLFKKESAGIVGTEANYDKAVNNGFDLENSLLSMSEELILAGTQDHKLQVSFPNFSGANYQALQDGHDTSDTDTTFIANSDYQSKIGFMAIGYLIPGGTDDRFRNNDANPYKDAI